ncbi:MAG: hypothetical protein KDD54_08555 [Flavobacteriales bacterium]|nr:hypothetical protein [Flavobacteriales bacterium]
MYTEAVEIMFVYRAGNGIFDRVNDAVHKVLSPRTYPCRLCMLTHGHSGMKREWREFVSSLPFKATFLHQDQLNGTGIPPSTELPAVFIRSKSGSWRSAITADELNGVESLPQLISMVSAIDIR